MKRLADLLQEGQGHMVKVSRAVAGDARARGPGGLAKPAPKAIEEPNRASKTHLRAPLAGGDPSGQPVRRTVPLAAADSHPGQELEPPAFPITLKTGLTRTTRTG